MKIYQIILVMLLISNFFSALWIDFNGRKERAAYGYSGGVITIIITLLLFLVYYKAGAFSTLILN